MEVCNLVQLSIAGWLSGSKSRDWYPWMEAPGCRFEKKFPEGSRLCPFFLLLHRLNVGVQLPVTVPAVQCTLTDMVGSHVAADPRTALFTLRYYYHGKNYHPFVGSGGEGLRR